MEISIYFDNYANIMEIYYANIVEYIMHFACVHMDGGYKKEKREKIINKVYPFIWDIKTVWVDWNQMVGAGQESVFRIIGKESLDLLLRLTQSYMQSPCHLSICRRQISF